MKWLFFSYNLGCPRKDILEYCGILPTKDYLRWRWSNQTEKSCQQPSSISLKVLIEENMLGFYSCYKHLSFGSQFLPLKADFHRPISWHFPIFSQCIYLWGFLKCTYISNELTLTWSSHNQPEAHSEPCVKWLPRAPFRQCSHIHLWLHLNGCLSCMSLT